MSDGPGPPPELSWIRSALEPRYEVQDCIGIGGTSFVYRAVDTHHGREVAIKLLRPEFLTTAAAVRFVEAARRTAQLQHPHIVPLYESQVSGGLVYFSMPLAPGASLRDRLERTGRLPAAEALEITRQIADALSYAHRHGVIHRDIKPENILLGDGNAQLADFGIARALEIASEETRLTSRGIVLGTPAYMSPEQIRNDPALDGRSDLYSLGCVLYEMLSGRKLFSGSGPEVMARQLGGPVQPLPPVGSRLPESVRSLLGRSLQSSPEDRFRDAAAMRDAAAAAERDVDRRARTRARAFWRPLGWAALTALLIAGGVRALHRSEDGEARWGPSTRGTRSFVRIAVMPFRFHGPAESVFLSDGASALIRFALDGAGPIRCVDAGPVARARGDPPGPTPEVRARVAHTLHADAVVQGDVIVLGDKVRIESALYPNPMGVGKPLTVAAEGTADQLSATAAKVAAAIAASRLRGRYFLTGPAIGSTQVSLKTLKSFLRAEEAFRGKDLDGAQAEMQHALSMDSTFAIGWARLAWFQAMAANFAAARRSVRVGVSRQSLLPRREALYLRATHGFVWGRAEEAEAAVRVLTDEYPGDVDAWRALAGLLAATAGQSPRGRG